MLLRISAGGLISDTLSTFFLGSGPGKVHSGEGSKPT